MSNAFAPLDPIDFQAKTGLVFGAASTPGTPIAAAITTALAETAAFATFRNTDAATPAGGGRFVIPQYLRLVCRTAPASATSLQLAISLDDIDRYTSGGSALVGSSSRSDQLDTTKYPAKADLRVGALVTTAAGARRKWITNKILKNAIPVIGDVFTIVFGDVSTVTLQALTGAASQEFVHVTDPIALAPGGASLLQAGAVGGNNSLVIHIWEPANAATAGQYDIEAGWIEQA